jgi:hypothetical protein
VIYRDEREENELFQQRLMTELRETEGANATWDGEVPNVAMQSAAQKKSYKQRKKEERQTKAAKRLSPYADYRSEAAMNALLAERDRRENVLTDNRDLLDQTTNDKDRRLLTTFCRGYETDPEKMSEQDIQNKDLDRQFVDDYLSRDLQRRTPHLRRMTEEALSLRLTPAMLSEEYILTHPIEMLYIVKKFTSLDDIVRDKVNKPFFDNLPAPTDSLFRARMEVMKGLGAYVTTTLKLRGVEASGSKPIYMQRISRDAYDQFAYLREQSYEMVISAMREDVDNQRRVLSNTGL